jgi:hypothetical protein
MRRWINPVIRVSYAQFQLFCGQQHGAVIRPFLQERDRNQSPLADIQNVARGRVVRPAVPIPVGTADH